MHPPGEAWTQYNYVFPVGAPTTLSVFRRPYGTGVGATPETSSYYYYDAVGRLVLTKQQRPGGWATTKTVYDSLNRVTSVSMPEFHGTSAWEAFSPANSTVTTYDRYGRPTTVQTPDHNYTSFLYTGTRIKQRTACVASGVTVSPCFGLEQPFTTTETYDGHGRLASVVEPLATGFSTNYGGVVATGVLTTYSYDVGNRLAHVNMQGTDGTQDRYFTYDLAGLLTSEQHPEKGVSGNGVVTYNAYDARGHVLQRIDGSAGGAFDLLYSYDSAERLVDVQDLDAATHLRRDLKTFTFATDNPSGNPRLGRLLTATRHNYTPGLGGDVAVAETYSYDGATGRVTERDTTAGGGGFPSTTFTMAQTWDDLGNILSQGYPSTTAAIAPARTVSFSYTNGILASVGPYTTGLTYLANGMIAHVGHLNGQADDWTGDPNGMSRPASAQISSNGVVQKSIGPYAYDGSGNIKQIGPTSGLWTVYAYDGLSRLTAAAVNTPPSSQQTWGYDSFGNRAVTNSFVGPLVDPNGDGIVDPSDIIYLVNYIFLAGPPPVRGVLGGDANGDFSVDSGDIFYLVHYLYTGGPAPL